MVDVFYKLKSLISLQDQCFESILKMSINFNPGDIFIAGGAVRDILLGNNNIKDVDLFIKKDVFNKFYEYFLTQGNLSKNPFGSYRWYPNSERPFYYDIIIIEEFFNGLWACENIIDVLNQFDITVNAIAIDLNSKEFFNPQNGLLHIKQKILRGVRFDFPDIPLSDSILLSRNSILWFRLQHYSNKLGLSIDLLTSKWLESNSYRIKDISLFRQYFYEPVLK